MSEVFTTSILEGTTAIYSTTLVDEDSVAIGGAQVTVMTLTYYDVETNQILNSRDEQNVLNTNNVTLSAGGVLEWLLQSGDTVIIDDRKELERHKALFTWLWGSDRIGRHEIEFDCENVLTVP